MSNAGVDLGMDALKAGAIEQAGLSDFGDDWFFKNLARLLPTLESEASLSLEGRYGAQSSIVNSLVNRLRHVDLLRWHPEILDEQINVAAIVVGLPRTGSTMLHRMLASAPGMTGVRWFETQNYAPFPDEKRGEPTARRAAAEGVLGYMLEKLPELMSIHPMSVDQPDEEVIILGHLFSSTMPEASYYVPSFAHWLIDQDPAPAYLDLKEILQTLQWLDPSRRGARWVLKTPGHLMAIDTALSVFPDARIVMTHRTPVETVPSYCSMMQTLYRLSSNDVTPHMVADFWGPRLKALLDRFSAARASNDPDRFVDIHYKDLLDNPITAGEQVLKAAGLPADDQARSDMAEWIEANKREHRAPHAYSAEEFGLSADAIKRDFADYIEQFAL
ncbi:MAG: sulfotransferase [Pseudomonadota bacterium]